MREIHVQRPQLHAPDEPELVQYRSLSGLAMAGLLVGLLSWLAMLSPTLWVLPVAGLVINAIALRRLATSAVAMVGRKAALVGLLLSAAFAAAGPVQWTTYRWFMRNEARQFGLMWFDFLAGGEPHKAYELLAPALQRHPLDDDLWRQYPGNSRARRDLEIFVRRPSVAALLKLRGQAQVRYYDTEEQWQDRDGDWVYQTYAVTCPVQGEPTTFFVGLVLQRSFETSTGRAFWKVANTRDAVKPAALGGSGKPN
jgi:hypothetical protein